MWMHRANPMLKHISEIRETSDLAELAELINNRGWVAVAAAQGSDGTWLFCLARLDLSRGACQSRTTGKTGNSEASSSGNSGS